MSIRRIVAIVVIFFVGVVGWVVLGTATVIRSGELGLRMEPEVQELWGAPLVQESPSLTLRVPGTDRVRALLPSRNDVDVRLRLDYRRRGLIWYPTYVCDFAGTYAVTNPEAVALKVELRFPFPAARGTYDGFTFTVDGSPVDVAVKTEEGVREILELAPGQTREFRVTYVTRGLREWRYRPDRAAGRVRNLTLAVRTDFAEVDYPEGAISPTEPATPDGTGTVMRWRAGDLITTQDIGIAVPEKLNPGPIAARMSFFAPVSLVFFFVLIATLNIVWRVAIHPMHYLFTTAGFFAFHLLFAYLVDHLDIHVAFGIAAAASLVLVTTYLAAALGKGFPWKVSAAGQLFYLVLFSYTFFLKGFTGLVVTVGSVVTLAVLMRVTAKTDWGAFFGGTNAPARTTPPAGPAPAPAA
jgi:hypothetical protein